MNRVSRPLQIGLVAVIAFFAIWTVALKPSSSSSGTATPAPAPPPSTKTSSNGILSAPAKARKAVGTADAAGAASAGASAATPGSSTTPVTPVMPSSTVSATPPAQSSLPTATTPTPPPQTKAQTKAPTKAPAAGHAAVTQSADQRLGVVGRAIKAHKVVAMLFYNSASPDDREVRRELATIPYKGGKVISLAVPIVELSRYPVVTTQVPVLGSPTLVIVDPRQQASTIVGFADTFEISQRIVDAVSVH